MSLQEELSALERGLADRQDWRAEYARLALERLTLQVELDATRVLTRLQELKALLEERPPERTTKDPLLSLFEALEDNLKEHLKVREYEQLEKSVQGAGDRQAAWRELLSRLEPASTSCTLPTPGKNGRTRRQDQLSLKVLLRLAESERRRPPAEVRADREELRLAREDRRRGVARLESLLAKLEAQP